MSFKNIKLNKIKNRIRFLVRYIYRQLGGKTAHKMKSKLHKLNREIEMVSSEIEYLKLIRDNNLKYSVYKDLIQKKLAGHEKQ